MKLLTFAALFLATTSLSMAPIPTPAYLPTDFEAGKQGLVDMLSYLHSAQMKERVAFSRRLFPTRSDCEAIFLPKIAQKAYQLERKLYRQYSPVVTPNSGTQTEVACWEGDRHSLLAYEDEARFFQGGYRELARYVKPGVKLYRIKYLEPGRTVGASYDVFAHVNGRWCLLWQVWRVIL